MDDDIPSFHLVHAKFFINHYLGYGKYLQEIQVKQEQSNKGSPPLRLRNYQEQTMPINKNF